MASPRLVLHITWLAVCICGCSGGEGVELDGAVDGGAVDGGPRADASWLGISPPTPPAPPADPMWPQMGPCPDGWREVGVEGFESDLSVCDPWPASGRATCDGVEAHLPGDPGCAPVGGACPTGNFPEGIPSGDPVLYVRARALAGGTGTRASPLRTIGAAISAASPGTIIAIAKGTYPESVRVTKDVTLWGACAGGVTLEPASGPAALVTLDSNVTIRNMSLEPGARPGVGVLGGRLVLRGVAILGGELQGILASGGDLDARDVLIRDVASQSSDGRFGVGIDVVGGGSAALERVAVHRARMAGVRVLERGTSLVLRDSVVTDSLGEDGSGNLGSGVVCAEGSVQVARSVLVGNRADGLYVTRPGAVATVEDSRISEAHGAIDGLSTGARADMGAVLQLRRSYLHGNRHTALLLNGASASSMFEDVVLEGAEVPEAGSPGWGLAVVDASLQGARLLVQRAHAGGVYIEGPLGHTVHLSDVRVVGTRGLAGGGGGAGIQVRDGSVLELDRASIHGSLQSGVHVRATMAHLRDVRVTGTRPDEGGNLGGGMFFVQGASGDLTRAHVEDNRGSGLLVAGEGTSVVVEDLSALETGADAEGFFGSGVEVQNRGHMELRRAELRGNHYGAITVWHGGVLAATDVRITATRAQLLDDKLGYGLMVGRAAELSGTRMLLDGCRGGGLYAAYEGTRVMLSDVEIRDIAMNDGIPDDGFGVLAFRGAHVEISRSLIERARLVGVLAAEEDTRVVLDQVEIADTVPDPHYGRFGRGVSAQFGGSIEGSEVRIGGSTEFGALSVGPGASVRFADATIWGTRAGGCVAGGCGESSFGVNAGSHLGASLALERFGLLRADLCGALIGEDSEVDLTSGTVSGQPIGACVQHDGYDVARLNDEVVYLENEQNLQTTSLPVPDVVGPSRTE